MLYKLGYSCILREEGISPKRGTTLPALDAQINKALTDIRNITEQKSNYGAAIYAKMKQLNNFNLKCNESASTICLYFHDPKMYTGTGCVTKGIEWISKKFGIRATKGLDKIIIVTKNGHYEEIINLGG